MENIYIECKNHKERMVEKIGRNGIIAFCLSCESEKKYAEEMAAYKDQIKAYNNHPRRITWKKGPRKGLWGWLDFLFTSISVGVIFLFFGGGMIFGSFELMRDSKLTQREFYIAFGLFVLVILFLLAVVHLLIKDRIQINPKHPHPPAAPPNLEGIRYRLKMDVDYLQPFTYQYKKNLYKEFIAKNARFEELDQMDGFTFEDYMGEFFGLLNYMDITVTKRSGDGGVDLVVHSDEKGKIAVQCKRHKISNPVGVSAIQEVYAGKGMYDCAHAMVVTTSYYTKAAKEMAKKLNVELWDRKKLMAEHAKVKSSGVTWKEFLMERYILPKKESKINIS